MRVNVMQMLTDWDGSPLQIPIRACPICGQQQELSPPLTLRSVCLNSLGATLKEDQQNLSREMKFTYFKLGTKIQESDIVELTVQEAALLQDRIDKFYLSSLIVPQALLMLEAGE